MKKLCIGLAAACVLAGVVSARVDAQSVMGGLSFYHLIVIDAKGRFTFPDTVPTLFMWTHKKFGYPDGYTVVLFKSPRLLTEADFAGQAELLLYVASEWKSAIRQEISGNGAFTQFITNTTIRRMLLELLR